MKRVFAAILTLILALSLLVGCGASDNDVSQAPDDQEVGVIEDTGDESVAIDENVTVDEVPEEETMPEEQPMVDIFAGKDLIFMEEGVEYDYYSATANDPSITTIGSAVVNNYRVVDSEGSHAARDGWKWHIADVCFYFYDSAAADYGYRYALCSIDRFYGLNTETKDLPPVHMNGQEYAWVDESEVLVNGWNEDFVAEVICEYAVQFPEGYTDAVICFYNCCDSAQGIEWTTTEDYLREDSCFFALNKQ